MSDIDGWLLDFIPTTDGIWSLYGFDDDRPMAAWSGPHYERAIAQCAVARDRVTTAEWTLNDVRTRGAQAAVIAKAEQWLADTQAELAAWTAQRNRLEAARAAA